MRLAHRSPVSAIRRDRLMRVVWAVSAVLSWVAAFALANVATWASVLGAGMFAVFGLVFTIEAGRR